MFGITRNWEVERMKKNTGGIEGWFERAAKKGSGMAGRAMTFALAVLILMIWAASGPIFSFNNTWQLVINTSTTIITFLMVFLIQNSQNRDTAALQIKLDEIVRAIDGADNRLLDLEELSTKELEKRRGIYEQIARDARSSDTSP